MVLAILASWFKKCKSFIQRRWNRLLLIYKSKKLQTRWVIKILLGAVFTAILRAIFILGYDEYKQGLDLANLPSVEIQQIDPHLSAYFSEQIEFVYIISNSGKTRANNIELGLWVPNEAYLYFIPNLFNVKIGDNNGILTDSADYRERLQKPPKFVEIESPSLDPGEYVRMFISMDRKKFESDNNILPINSKKHVRINEYKTLSFFKKKFKEGIPRLHILDSLKLSREIEVTAKSDFENKLINGFELNDELSKEYVRRIFGGAIHSTDRIFKELRKIKSMVDETDDRNDIKKINKLVELPEFPRLTDMVGDTLLNKVVSTDFQYLTSASFENIEFLKETWWNEKLSQKEAYKILTLYFNQIEFQRVIMSVESNWLREGKNLEHGQAIKHYTLNKIKNDSLPVREFSFNSSSFE